MMFRAIVAVILPLAFHVPSLYGKTFRGAIQGTVMDSSGSAVARTELTAIGEETNFVRQALTDDSGNYVFTELPLGSYRISAVKSGFQKQIVTGIHVKVAAFPRVDLTLVPGQVTEVIEVVGNVPLLETSGDNQGGTIEGRQASELPVNGRDFG